MLLNTADALEAFHKSDILRIIRMHADNGREFEGDFLRFLEENHIHRSRSTPETPQENSIIERHVGEVKRGIRAFLLEAQHPIAAWEWAATVWVLHRNAELPNAAELGCDRKQRFRYGQRVIGKQKEPDDTFSPTGKPYIFIGYTDYGYVGIDEKILWSEHRICVERFSSFKLPNEIVFPSFPPVFLKNKNLTDLSEFEIYDVCHFHKLIRLHHVKVVLKKVNATAPRNMITQ